MADTCDLNLYEDKEFTYPENFFDTYDGRLAAASQEMSIAKDMDLIYDLKMQRSDKETFKIVIRTILWAYGFGPESCMG